jgi:hypothetical protein
LTSSPDIFAQLAAPFPPEVVQWRVGSTNRRKFEAKQTDKRRGLPLCYIDARDVMNRLDEVVTPADWQTGHTAMHNGTTCCRLGVLVGERWVWKSDGAGATGDVRDGNEREMAEKGAYSDALKRAGVLWGIGRYLYAVKAKWIELDEWWGIPDAAYPGLRALLPNGTPLQSRADTREPYNKLETQLRACKTERALKTLWANSQEMIATWPDGWRQSITEEKDRAKARLEHKEAA